MSQTGENICKRKDGRREARYIYAYDAEGKARYRCLYAGSYAEVKKKLTACLAAPPGEQSEKRKRDSYGAWLDEWLQSKRFLIKESSYMRYRNTVENHIKPSLGQYAIEKIGTDLMKAYIFEKLQDGRINTTGGLSAKSVSDILVIIKESFRYADACGARTICRFDRISFKRNARSMRVLSVAEEKRLVSVLTEMPDRLKLGVFLCLYTGIRIGELCALKWKHISLSEKSIRIEQTIQRLPYEHAAPEQKTRLVVTEPKSLSSCRTIPLPNFLADAIAPYAGGADGYILSVDGHSAVEPRTMQNRFKKYLVEGNIEDANFHALRHTFATRCVEAGFDIKTLSEILGHASVKITLDKYVHSSMELKRRSMDKLRPACL